MHIHIDKGATNDNDKNIKLTPLALLFKRFGNRIRIHGGELFFVVTNIVHDWGGRGR